MTKTIDHYDYWNSHRNVKKHLYDREKLSLQLLSRVAKKHAHFLDAGCGHGDFLMYVRKYFPELKIKGLDYSKKEVVEACRNGFDVSQSNFEEGIGLKSNQFDIAYAGELIEHLYNPDIFLSEMHRIIKKDGYFIISTPNLHAWFNRILFPLGIQPLFVEMSVKSRLVGAGILKKLKGGITPVGHVRIFTLAALKDILGMYGFDLITLRGASYEEGLPRWLLPLDRLFKPFPALAPQLVLLARKTRKS